MATSRRKISIDTWESMGLTVAPIRKQDMNKLVMNFLESEGYVDAAEKFSKESGTEVGTDLVSINDRKAVKHAVLSGNVMDAIEKVNNLNPEILEAHPQLLFHLQLQNLVELIRNDKVVEAMDFAQKELAPKAEKNRDFSEELEEAVTLLVFKGVSNFPLAHLLDFTRRFKIAREVNAAILTSQGHEDPVLAHILKMLLLIQDQLKEEVGFPRVFAFQDLVSQGSTSSFPKY